MQTPKHSPAKFDGHAVIEAALKKATKGDLADAPFPLTGEVAQAYLAGQASAYQHALEMIPLPESTHPQVMEALQNFAKHGTYHDTNPTRLLPLNEEATKVDAWWLNYFQRADQNVRDTAKWVLSPQKTEMLLYGLVPVELARAVEGPRAVGLSPVFEAPYGTKELGACPELNLSNYTEGDVEKLNDWAILASEVIEKLQLKRPTDLTPRNWRPIDDEARASKRCLYLAKFDKDGNLLAIDAGALWQYWQESFELSHINGYAWESISGLEDPTHYCYQEPDKDSYKDSD